MSLNVLIVDDSAAIRKILHRVLMQADVPLGSVVEAGEGVEALSKLKQGPVGLILSDINMPNMDGIELLSKLKSNPSYKSVPVLMVTTEGSQAKVLQALDLGAVGYVRKPVFATMLNLRLDDREPYEKIESDPPEDADGVEALVGIAGSWSGTGRICCTPQFACQMAGALLMTEYSALNTEVLDAMAEVANMIVGNVKTHFEETLGPLDLSIPMVIFGRHYRTRSIGAFTWIVIPFQSVGYAWEVRFCLMPNRTRPSHAPQQAALQSS